MSKPLDSIASFPVKDRPWLHRFARRAASRSRAAFGDGELEAVADLAAVRAWRRYDAAKGFAFTTYARWSVLGAVRRAVRERRDAAARRGPDAALDELLVDEPRLELVVAARRAVDTLDAMDRSLLLRHVVAEESLDDLARELSVPKTTLWRRLHAAMARVRRLLGVR
ncbi:MAG: sigma-70 family RNA polymerase sigma factor [Deltaproteobacteria bacterium]|nr:MAG: sigma-70 family RNA polymerase sigma factor [Deltaproteobacteria bacterium]